MKRRLKMSLMLFHLLAGAVNLGVSTPAAAETPAATLRLTPEGAQMRVIGPLGQCAVEAQLDHCQADGEAVSEPISSGGFKVVRHQSGPAGQKCTITESLAPKPGSIRWEIEVVSDGEWWTTPIVARLKFPAPGALRFWTAWMREEKTLLTPTPLGTDSWPYGQFFQPGIALPLATVMSGSSDSGLSLVVSPENTLLTTTLSTSAQGEVAFHFENLRLGHGKPVRLALDLVAHEADWRGGLRWLTGCYPEYFDPPNPKVQEMAGCGCYSGAYRNVDYARLKNMGFRVRWEAAFDWPTYGMFLPPVGDQETWTSIGRYALATHGQSHQASFKLMNDRARQMHANGTWHLSYFNVGDFGTRMKLAPVNFALPEKDLWKDPVSFAARKLSDSMWRTPQGQPTVAGWDGAMSMDPASPAWRAYLIAQARKHLEKIPDSDGLAIDRLSWSYPTLPTCQPVNYGANDGIGWYDGRAGRHFSVSFKSIMDDLGSIMHPAGKVIFYNSCMAYRLDCYKNIDGFFDEAYPSADRAVAGTGLLALRKPAIIWTESKKSVLKNPDLFFQRHLLLGVFPMAPFPANDHSIGPDPAVERFYLDYAPLLLAMRGKQWVLEPHCIEIEDRKAQANLFEVPGGWVVPVTFGPREGTVHVVIRNVPDINGKLTIDALQPGMEMAQLVTFRVINGGLELAVPLKQGCAMVRLIKTHAKGSLGWNP